MKIFAIFDSAAEAFNPPFFMATHGMAERAFTDTANDTNTQINKHPDDFTLFYFGEFDQNTGEFDLEAAPKRVMNAIQTEHNT